MFGYVEANKKQLTSEEERLYRGYYCGLCRSLRRQFGTVGRLTLNYDITFMALFLADLYDEEGTGMEFRCAVHPRKPQYEIETGVLDYAAAMNILLAYYNLQDNWEDDKNVAARNAARRLRKFLPEIAQKFPAQAEGVRREIEAMRREESRLPREADTAANISGRLLGHLFVYRKDHWSEDCRKLGEAIGRFVYWMDAYEDLEKDRERGRYNPFILLADNPDYEQRVHEMLTGALGEAAVILERLPLVEHLSLLRNIIYSGVWNRYRAKGEEK